MVPLADQPKSDEGSIFMPGITITVLLIILGAAAILIFSIIQIISNPKGAMRGLIGLVGLLVIFGIAYAMASNEVNPEWHKEGDIITPGISQYVGSAISTTGILIGLALLAFVVSEIRNFFK